MTEYFYCQQCETRIATPRPVTVCPKCNRDSIKREHRMEFFTRLAICNRCLHRTGPTLCRCVYFDEPRDAHVLDGKPCPQGIY